MDRRRHLSLFGISGNYFNPKLFRYQALFRAVQSLAGNQFRVTEAAEGLSRLAREEIWTCLAQLRAQGQTIPVTDKHVERLLALADRHIVIERGRVVWSGNSEE